MSHRAWLCAWLLAVVAVTLVHDPAWLAAGLAAALLASGQGRGALSRRAVRAVLPILLVISTGYLVMGWLTGELAWRYLLLLNLRVLLLALLTTWMVRDVNLERALQGFPGAQRWLSIVRSQVTVFRRLATEYRAAVQSRSTIPPTLLQRYRAGAALGLAALDKAMYNSEALTQGMRSRGALDD
jgi:cobalt/nickel transport system permease protein